MAINNEITVVIGNSGVKAITTRGSASKHGVLDLDPLRRATIQVFKEFLLDDSIHSRKALEVLGQHLFSAIFDKGVDEFVNRKISDVAPQRLRLQLQFEADTDPEVINYPWEFLYSPSREDFLATDVNLVLTHYIELDREREDNPQEEGPLRVLICISRPQDEAAVVAKDVVEKINSLNVAGQDPSVEVRLVKQPNLTSIEESLKTFKPHIFHFIGHGKYNQYSKTGYLLLVNPETGNADPCDDATLIDCFRYAQAFPNLVFLQMCDGAVAERDATVIQAFSGFAPKLIHAKITSIVAMQYPIKNPDANDFSLSFYKTLAEGGSVDEAVQDGRHKLDRKRQSRLFGTPVLYMHSADGLVLPRQPKDKSDKSPTPHEGRSYTASAQSDNTEKTAGNRPAPLDSQAILNKVVNEGNKSIHNIILDGDAQIDLNQQLVRMTEDLAGKSRTDIYNAFFQAWQTEANNEVKKVWGSIMQVV